MGIEELAYKILLDFHNNSSISGCELYLGDKSEENLELFTNAIKYLGAYGIISNLDYAKVKNKYAGVIFTNKAEITSKGFELLSELNA